MTYDRLYERLVATASPIIDALYGDCNWIFPITTAYVQLWLLVMPQWWFIYYDFLCYVETQDSFSCIATLGNFYHFFSEKTHELFLFSNSAGLSLVSFSCMSQFRLVRKIHYYIYSTFTDGDDQLDLTNYLYSNPSVSDVAKFVIDSSFLFAYWSDNCGIICLSRY